MQSLIHPGIKINPCIGDYVSFSTGLFGFYVPILDNSRAVLNPGIQSNLTASRGKRTIAIEKVRLRWFVRSFFFCKNNFVFDWLP